MKKLFTLLTVFMLASFAVFAQIQDPVKWSYAAKKLNSKEAVVMFRAKIDKGWHIYSQNIASGGPTKTAFTFAPSADYTLNGKTAEPKAHAQYDPNFKMNVLTFDNEVVFQQRIKLKKATTVVKGKLEYGVCDATRCLPPNEVAFAIPVK